MMIESVSDINSTSPSQHKPRGKKGSSASSQGSARSHRSEARRDTSSSSDQSDEERKSKSKRRVQRRRPPAFSTEEDDDERTDSADEGGDALKGSQSPPMTHTSFYNQYSSSTFSQPILKPLSPISLQVGYGSDLIHAGGRAGGGVLNNALDLSIVPSAIESDERRGETVAVIDSGVVDSSPQSVHHHDPESPVNDERLLPEVSIVQGVLAEQDPRPTIPTLPPKPVTIATAGSSSVLPSPSLGPPTTNTALPFAGWGWGQPTLYSPFCATSGSVAGTPAVTDGLTPSLTSGTNTYLQAAICQELDGVLVVNVRWRNKTFSGSLIDVQHHKWAPPRLSDTGVPDMTLKLKDLLGGSGAGGGAKVSADSEKDSVDVEAMEDQPRENGDQQNRDDSKESSIIAMETGDSTNIDREQSKLIDRGQFTDVDTVKSSHLNGEHSLSSDQTSSPLRQSNGLHQVPSTCITGGSEEKTKTGPSLPPFDAVKSPQPQLALDEKDKPKETTPPSNNPPSVVFPPTVNSVIVAGGGGDSKMAADNHVNFHTLVDVAASMKPVHDEKGVVSSDDTLSDKETSSDCLKSTLAYHPDDHGLHLHGNRGDDSDSSGSGSLSPVKKKVPHRKVAVVSTPSVVKEAKEDGKQMELSFNSASFLNNHQIPPISPGDHASGHAPTHSAVIEKEMLQPQPPKVIKGQFWSPASVNSTIGKELDSRYPPNVDTSNPSAHFPPHALAHYSDTCMPPGAIMIPGNPPHTVIQDKGKGLGGSSRKRKPEDSSSHKHQMSPPTNKDIDSMRMMSGKPLPPLPSSFKTGKPSDPSVIMQPGGVVQSQGDGKSVPDGFVYEPSLPMSREYQIIAYERERQKAAEEKLKAEGSGLPKLKRAREQHDHRHASSPSPPSSFKKDRIHHQPSVIPPGVVVSDHMIHRHMGGIVSHSPQIKQEHRPSRPPSKPGHHHHSSSSGGSSSSKTGGPSQPDKKRSHQPRKDGAIISGTSIKKEPEQIQQWLPPGSLPPTSFVPIAGGMAQPTILNLPPGLSISSPSHLPPSFSAQYLLQPNSALAPPPSSSKPKDSIHSRARQTPSPNPKKPHEWQSHGFSGHPHVITPTPTKPEHGSSRHGQLPGEGKSQSGGGHLRMPHSSSRHKQDGGGGSSSSRSIPPHSHPPQPSPTHSSLRNGIAATPILTAGGVPTTNEEFMKLNLLQLEALKNSGGAGLTFQSPQDFLTWQAAARAGQLSAMGIPQSNEAAFQMQLLAQQQMAAAAMAQQQHQQQQQQQQQNEAAMANFQQALAASQGMPAVIPFMQPFPLATPTGVFTIPPPPPNKRDS